MLSKLLTASASVVGLTAASCNLFQTCANNEGKQPGQRLAPCADPSAVAEPVFYDFEPEVMTNPLGLSNLALACPFIDPTQALCCNSDNAAIMRKFNPHSLTDPDLFWRSRVQLRPAECRVRE